MKPCPHCGEQIADTAVFCPHCQKRVEEKKKSPNPMRTDHDGAPELMLLLSFLAILLPPVNWVIATIGLSMCKGKPKTTIGYIASILLSLCVVAGIVLLILRLANVL